jgi:hypothetical protein
MAKTNDGHHYRIIMDRDLWGKVERSANGQGISVNQLINDLLEREYGNLPAQPKILAWFKADDLGPNSGACLGCGEIESVWFALQSTGQLVGPYCRECGAKVGA